MEIIHAAYRTRSQNAAFLVRKDEFVKYLPPEMMGAFVDAHPLNKAHLKVFMLYRIFAVFLHFFFSFCYTSHASLVPQRVFMSNFIIFTSLPVVEEFRVEI